MNNKTNTITHCNVNIKCQNQSKLFYDVLSLSPLYVEKFTPLTPLNWFLLRPLIFRISNQIIQLN